MAGVVALVATAVVTSLASAEVTEVADIQRVDLTSRAPHPANLLPDLTAPRPAPTDLADPGSDLTSPTDCAAPAAVMPCSVNDTVYGAPGRRVRGQCRCPDGWAGPDCSCHAALCRRLSPDSEPCGGPARGVCDCDVCQCQPGWAGLFCDCTLSEVGCRPPVVPSTVPVPVPDTVPAPVPAGAVCSDRGSCVCGRCTVCHPPSWGRYCQHGPHSPCPVRLSRCLRCRITSLRYGGVGWCRACVSPRLVLLVQDELVTPPELSYRCRVSIGGCRVPVVVQRTLSRPLVVRLVAEDLLCDDVISAAPVTSSVTSDVTSAVTSYVTGLMMAGVMMGYVFCHMI